MLSHFRKFYGANPLHLLALLASFALLGYVISVVGPVTLWNPVVWWQSILVWFLGAVVLHDLVLFPLYALADRSLTAGLRAMASRRESRRLKVPVVNYLRIPALTSGLLFLVFFPGIIEQGTDTYLAATGQTQDPFLGRWLLAVAVIFGLSAVAYAIRLGVGVGRRSAATPLGSGSEQSGSATP
jgi:hypothetical protein